METKCRNCDRDITIEVQASCASTGGVLRERREAGSGAAGGPARQVFVDCPFCGFRAEYACAPTEGTHAR